MKKMFSSFLKEEEGSIIEYVILIAVVAVIIALLFPILKDKMGEWFGGTMTNMDCGIGGTSEMDNPELAKHQNGGSVVETDCAEE